MAINTKRVLVEIGDTDAVLLQGSLRSYRDVFEQAGNEVMTGMLDRVEESLEKANKGAREMGQTAEQPNVAVKFTKSDAQKLVTVLTGAQATSEEKVFIGQIIADVQAAVKKVDDTPVMQGPTP